MFFRNLRNTSARGVLALLLAVCVAAGAVNAGVINHGMVMGPGVAYIDITETSDDPVPLYGAPVTIGDDLAFFEPSSPNPSLGFSAQAGGGTVDLTDGFLNMTIMAKPAAGAIGMITFSEGGDYTMQGLANTQAQVSATLNVFELRILEVDGSPIDPIVLSDIQTTTKNFPPDTVGQWDLSSTFNINQALTDAGETFTLGATKLTARINNTLTALTTPGAVAGIFKKDFDIEVETPLDPDVIIPEPTSLALAGLALAAVLGRRRVA
ncbi:MAG: PEP-CTERM sorting domain-containing protein [Planctomycetota bacterium]